MACFSSDGGPKQQLQARGLEGGNLYKRLENLEKSLDAEFDCGLAGSILEDLPRPDLTRKLDSAEPDGYKTLRDILNEMVKSHGALETLVPKPRPSDKKAADS
jgi:hypothetical protein